MLPVVDIGATYSSIVYGNKNIVGTLEGRDGLVRELDIMWLVKDEGEVLGDGIRELFSGGVWGGTHAC